MKTTKTQMGAGYISPTLASHLKKAERPQAQMGTGAISPKVATHLQQSAKPKTQMGAGISPQLLHII